MTIEMPRGDIRTINFTVVDDNDSPVSFFDEIYMTCKTNASSREVLFQKRLSEGSIVESGKGYTFTIEAKDTDYLKYGRYAFDIELIRGDVIKQTTVGALILTDEVTHPRDEV